VFDDNLDRRDRHAAKWHLEEPQAVPVAALGCSSKQWR